MNDGAIVVHESAGYPTWLRSARQYENFDFRGEFFVKGWMNSGIYLHAPEHGRNMWCGMKINIFHQVDETPGAGIDGLDLSAGAAAQGEREEQGRVEHLPHRDGLAAAAGVDQRRADPGPGRRDRAGAAAPAAQRVPGAGIALVSDPLSQSARAANCRRRSTWTPLYEAPEDLREVARLGRQAEVSRRWAGAAQRRSRAISPPTRSIAISNCRCTCGTRGITTAACCSGRQGKASRGRHYEIQLHDVEGAHYPTGSLYSVKRGLYPRIEPGQWWLFQLRVKDATCLVRINGETVLEYDRLDNLDEGRSSCRRTTRDADRVQAHPGPADLTWQPCYAIHAHPDDAEILAGGTLALLADLGHQIAIATFTPGDCGSKQLGPEEIAAVRRREAANAAALIGARYVCLEMRDLAIFDDDVSRRRVTETLRQTRPDLVLTGSSVGLPLRPRSRQRPGARRLLLPRRRPTTATRADDLRRRRSTASRTSTSWIRSKAERATARPCPAGFRGRVCCATTFARKRAMLAEHASQRIWLREHHGTDDYLDAMERWTRERGALVGVPFGEGFRLYQGHAYPQTRLLEDLLGPPAIAAPIRARGPVGGAIQARNLA